MIALKVPTTAHQPLFLVSVVRPFGGDEKGVAGSQPLEMFGSGG